MSASLVGSEMCIRDRASSSPTESRPSAAPSHSPPVSAVSVAVIRRPRARVKARAVSVVARAPRSRETVEHPPR
eukprot:5731455-Alexandrium_andersonii.AAC.1